MKQNVKGFYICGSSVLTPGLQSYMYLRGNEALLHETS